MKELRSGRVGSGYGFESGAGTGSKAASHSASTFVDERRGEASFTDLGRRLDQLRRLSLGVRRWWRLRLVVEGLLHDALRGLVFGTSIDLRGNGRREWHAREINTVREGGTTSWRGRAITGDRMGSCRATGRVRKRRASA